MGTSQSYGGPTGRTPLLPPWAPDAPPPNGEQETQPPDGLGAPPGMPNPLSGNDQPAWRVPKDAMRRYANSGNADQMRGAARGFVRAQGGAKKAARAASAGRATARRLGAALSAAVTMGSAEMRKALGIQYVGQDVYVLLAELVDAIAPDGASNEEAVARVAATDTLEALFEQYEVAEQGLEGLDQLSRESIGEVIEQYVSTYIYTRLMEVLASRLESNPTVSVQEVCRMERDIEGYIRESIKLELSERDILRIDWSSQEGYTFVEEIFTEGYELLEKGYEVLET